MSYLVISTTYRVRPEHRTAYLDAMRRVRENALDLGAIEYRLFEDDVQSGRFTEQLVYDGWMQWERARTTPPASDMAAIFDKMEEWVEGGTTEVQFMKSHLGRFA